MAIIQINKMQKITLLAAIFITMAIFTVIQSTDAAANVTDAPAKGPPGRPVVRLSCYRRCLRECRGKKNRGCQGNRCICVN